MVKENYRLKRKDDYIYMSDEVKEFKDELSKFLEKYVQMEKQNSKGPKYNVLAVGCHPDDVELGCGGVLLKHIERGDNVTVLVLTLGDKGNHHPNMRECKDAMSVLGVKNVIFGKFKDGYIADNHEVVDFIESAIKKYDINRVYTHDPHDRHQDHRNCSLATSAAARKLKEVLLYQGPSTNNMFDPHYFIELSERHLSTKVNALKSYESQVKKDIVNLEWIDSLARINGWRCKTRYAEAFALNHVLKGGDDEV